MKLIVFELWGKFAHFRKFYTNSSSLSYSIPPRTTAGGILAAILGLERDSYYEEFNSENLFIGVRKLTSTRKIMQSLNYIRATTGGELNYPKSHTQIPFELVMGDNNVGYRFYVTHKDEKIRQDINRRLSNNKPVYPPYFGSATFNCSINYIGQYGWEWTESNQYKDFYTAIDSNRIDRLDLTSTEGRLIKERMPKDFGKDRIIKDVTTYIYNEDGKAIRAKFLGEYARLDNGENITFM